MPKLLPDLPNEFSERFAAALRIEPRCRRDDFGRGIQARTADPLWMLARQWQTGEFLGEDAGSPINVTICYSTQAVAGVQTVDGVKLQDTNSDGNLSDIPLEVLVEQEDAPLNYRERVRIGQEFERRLRDKLESNGAAGQLKGLLQTLRARDDCGFPKAPKVPLEKLDRETQRFVRFMSRRVVDGAAILQGPLTAIDPSPLTQDELEAVRTGVVEWYQEIWARPTCKHPPAWQSKSLDYRFEVNGNPKDEAPPPENMRKVRLVAPDYRNGALDWYTFSAAEKKVQPGSWNNTSVKFPLQLQDQEKRTPTRIDVCGASPRWWAFEDAVINFGVLDIAKPDLAKLLLMEFALIYGDDWFSVPLPIPRGHLVKIDELLVKDVFGEKDYPITSALETSGRPTNRFDIFTISPVSDSMAPGIALAKSPPEPLLFVPSVSGFRQESAPLEEVIFLRDEMANMVWGVEQIVPNGLGRPVPGFDAQLERLERENDAESAGLIKLMEYADTRLGKADLSDAERDHLRILLYLAKARMEALNPCATPTPSQNDVPRYRLATSVPDNWVPFVPLRNHKSSTESPTPYELQRAKILRNTDHVRREDDVLTPGFVREVAHELGLPADTFLWMADGSRSGSVRTMSRLLALDEQALLRLHEEAVPRSGLRVQLTKQRMRWSDGSTYLWLGRKVLNGLGEGDGGLKFDFIE